MRCEKSPLMFPGKTASPSPFVTMDSAARPFEPCARISGRLRESCLSLTQTICCSCEKYNS
jgi:hypothetical protein